MSIRRDPGPSPSADEGPPVPIRGDRPRIHRLPPRPRRCRVCGCQQPGAGGYWVERNLCSACVGSKGGGS